MIGDYDTPEQIVVRMNMNNPWESCMTMCTNWACVPNDKMKSLQQCIRTLAITARGNGNLLLNVSPMMDGRMEANQVNLLKEMGDWLKQNGESIYNTKGGPYHPSNEMAAACKGNKIYLQILKPDRSAIAMKPFPREKIVKAYLLHGSPVIFTQNENGIVIHLSAAMHNKNCSVIVLELNGDAENIPLIQKYNSNHADIYNHF